MEKSEASLNFLSLEIAISVCVHKRLFLEYEHLCGMCLVWTSIIFLNLSIGQIFNIYFPFSGYVEKYSASLSLGAIDSLSFFSTFGD